jgi:2'-5' RNA ligase
VRLFVAAYPPPAAIADLAALFGRLALGAPRDPVAAERSLRAVPPERWHVTLAFIGEVPDDREPAARAALAVAAQRWSAAEPKPLRVALRGGGRFGRGRFTTVWIGLDGDVTPLCRLAAAVGSALRKARLPVDREKRYRPHVTLGRPGDRLSPQQVAGDLAVLNTYRGPEWEIDRIHLVRSNLGPNIHYEKIATWPLAQP